MFYLLLRGSATSAGNVRLVVRDIFDSDGCRPGDQVRYVVRKGLGKREAVKSKGWVIFDLGKKGVLGGQAALP